MSKEQDFRRNAEEAQRQANRTTSAEDKAAWLRIAEGWLSLLPRRRAETAEERFEDAVAKQRTGQGDSGTSH
jgi:hypothetical protein